jgi:hypothetical protein
MMDGAHLVGNVDVAYKRMDSSLSDRKLELEVGRYSPAQLGEISFK